MRTRAAAIALACLLAPAAARASGVKNSENGAAAAGMADAFVAVADDATAVYYNPAAMTRLEGTSLAVGVTPVLPSSTFTAGADLPQGAAPELRKGETAANVDGPSPLPHAYVVQRVPDAPLAVGLGAYLPYASGLAWRDDWAGRGQGIKSQVAALAVNPNLAWAVTPGFSVAAGFSLVQAALEVEQTLRANVGDPSEDIGAHIAADGQSYAGNVALLWDVTDRVAVGASYRSAVKVDMEGDVDFTVPGSAYSEFFPDQKVRTTFRFPDVVNAGVGVAARDDLKLDAEAEFARNNVYDKTVIEFTRGKPAASLTQAAKWRNTLTYRIGADYLASSRWNFRAGVAYDENPVPDETMGPASADADRIIGAVGASYHWRRHVVSLGAQLQHFLAREVTQADIDRGAPDLAGRYETELAVVSLTWSTTWR